MQLTNSKKAEETAKSLVCASQGSDIGWLLRAQSMSSRTGPILGCVSDVQHSVWEQTHFLQGLTRVVQYFGREASHQFEGRKRDFECPYEVIKGLDGGYFHWI